MLISRFKLKKFCRNHSDKVRKFHKYIFFYKNWWEQRCFEVVHCVRNLRFFVIKLLFGVNI